MLDENEGNPSGVSYVFIYLFFISLYIILIFFGLMFSKEPLTAQTCMRTKRTTHLNSLQQEQKLDNLWTNGFMKLTIKSMSISSITFLLIIWDENIVNVVLKEYF